MRHGTRKAIYDGALNIEAYCFDGIVEPFPAHVHGFYVVGLVERGERRLVCAGEEYEISHGDVLLFNPGDSHACDQLEGSLLYRAFKIPCSVMVTHLGYAPRFRPNILRDGRLSQEVSALYAAIENSFPERGEQLGAMLSYAANKYGAVSANLEYRTEVTNALDYMESHYSERVELDDVAAAAGLSKSALLRAFSKCVGVTPYRYLESVRVGEARLMLEHGETTAYTAAQCGFADQSHLTNCFGRLTGLTPGEYRKLFTKDSDKDEKRKVRFDSR